MVPETGTKNAHKMQPASQKKPASRRKFVNQNFVKTNWAKYGTGPKNEHHGAMFGMDPGAQNEDRFGSHVWSDAHFAQNWVEM